MRCDRRCHGRQESRLRDTAGEPKGLARPSRIRKSARKSAPEVQLSGRRSAPCKQAPLSGVRPIPHGLGPSRGRFSHSAVHVFPADGATFESPVNLLRQQLQALSTLDFHPEVSRYPTDALLVTNDACRNSIRFRQVGRMRTHSRSDLPCV